MQGQADFSECGKYRYTLRRQWLIGEGSVLWILLNPSTATATQDDPTIRRCTSFSESMGYQGFTLVNIFALRSTDPRTLLTVADPVGPDNDDWIRKEANNHARIFAAWGMHGALNGRGAQVASILSECNDVLCLGLTKEGHPRHPLYLAKTTKPQLFRSFFTAQKNKLLLKMGVV